MGLDWLRLIGQCLWATIITYGLCTAHLFRHFIWSRKQKSVKGQIIVVTGAGHGLGRRIACKMASLGAHVVCWDIDHERNLNTAWDIRQKKGTATEMSCDVTDRAAVFRNVAVVRETVGEIDMLINCVGIYPVKPSLTWSPEELYALFDSNVMANFWLLQAIVPHMIARRSGHVAVISSAAAIAPVSGELIYSATKSAVTGLFEGFLEELKVLGHTDIKCSVVHPYYTAVRDDLPVKFELRFDRLSPDYVCAEIVRGILQEEETFSVPRFMQFWLHFVKLLPSSARRRWRAIFYTRVSPSEDLSRHPNIIDRYKLPPLPSKPDRSPVTVRVI